MRALLELASANERGEEALGRAIAHCSQSLPTSALRPGFTFQCKDGALPCSAAELEWQARMEYWVKRPAYVFEPPVTRRGPVHKHPWDGILEVTVGDCSAGTGLFAACFRKAGATVTYLIEKDKEAIRLAQQLCPEAIPFQVGITDIDPMDVPWTHVLLGGPQYRARQPASTTTDFPDNGENWKHERASSILRMVHIMAVKLPWVAFIEVVNDVQRVQEGTLWRLITGTLEAIGYKVKLYSNCASRSTALKQQRRYLCCARADVWRKWGWPDLDSVVFDQGPTLASVKVARQDAAHLAINLPLDDVQWTPVVDTPAAKEHWGHDFTKSRPLQVAATWGNTYYQTAFDLCIPAITTTGLPPLITDSDGSDGRTVRQLHLKEAIVLYSDDTLQPTLSSKYEVALTQLGCSTPVRSILPLATEVMRFLHPTTPFVPTSVSDIIRDEDKLAIQGVMQLAKEDYDTMKKLN